MMGWECPKCGSCYSPFQMQCTRCGPESYTWITTSTGTDNSNGITTSCGSK